MRALLLARHSRLSWRGWLAVALLGSWVAPAARACDACGCFLGLTPYDNQSSLTVLHRYRAYNGYGTDTHHLMPTGAPFWRAAPGSGSGPASGVANTGWRSARPACCTPATAWRPRPPTTKPTRWTSCG